MLSAARGNRRAAAQAAALKLEMTPVEIADAKHRADGWQVAQASP